MAWVKELFVTIIVVSSLFIGVSSFYGSLSSTYNATTNETEIESLNMMSDIWTKLESSKDEITSEDASAEGIGDIMLKSSWNFMMQLFYSLPLVQTTIEDVAAILHIPTWASTMVLALLSLLFMMAILYATIKVKL